MATDRNTPEAIASEMADMVNILGYADAGDRFVEAMLKELKASQQQFLSKVLINFIVTVASMEPVFFTSQNKEMKRRCDILGKFIRENKLDAKMPIVI